MAIKDFHKTAAGRSWLGSHWRPKKVAPYPGAPEKLAIMRDGVIYATLLAPFGEAEQVARMMATGEDGAISVGPWEVVAHV